MVPSFKYHLHPRESLEQIVPTVAIVPQPKVAVEPRDPVESLEKMVLSPPDVKAVVEKEDLTDVKMLPALPNTVAETVRMELDVEDVETVKPEVVVEATVVPNLKVFQLRLKIKLLPKKLKNKLQLYKKLKKFSHPSQLRLKSLAFLSMMFLTRELLTPLSNLLLTKKLKLLPAKTLTTKSTLKESVPTSKFILLEEEQELNLWVSKRPLRKSISLTETVAEAVVAEAVVEAVVELTREVLDNSNPETRVVR